MSSQPASAPSLRDTNTRPNGSVRFINQAKFINQVKAQSKKYALRFTLALACAAAIALSASIAPHAQLDKNAAARIVSLSAREIVGGGKVFTIESSSAILRPQTWHDGEGLHVVIYKGEAKANLGAAFFARRFLRIRSKRKNDLRCAACEPERFILARNMGGREKRQRQSRYRLSCKHKHNRKHGFSGERQHDFACRRYDSAHFISRFTALADARADHDEHRCRTTRGTRKK